MANVLNILRSLQFETVNKAVKEYGHRLMPWVAFQDIFTNTCPDCGGGIRVSINTTQMPDGKLNHQMVAEGNLLIQKCKGV